MDYINCRAVSEQRLEIHGAVTVSITVTARTSKEAVSGVYGDDIILRRKEINAPVSEIRTEKRVTVTDTFDPGEAKPPVADILRASASVVSTDKKIVSNKLAVKGELKLSLLYTPAVPQQDNAAAAAPETMQFTLPFSQIMEADGMDDSYETSIRVTAAGCDVSPVPGSSRAVECSINLCIECTAVRYDTVYIVTDEFSPLYNTEHTSDTVKISVRPDEISRSIAVKGTAEHRDGSLESIYDAWCEVLSCDTMRCDDGSITVSGRAVCYCIAGAAGGNTVICTADTPFRAEGISSAGGYSPDVTADLTAEAVSCSYNLTSDNSAEIKAEILISGSITDYIKTEAITSITASEPEEGAENGNTGDIAVKLYFAEKGEDLWEVAKRCRTSPEAITAENELDGMIMQNTGMIVIPIP